MRKLSYVLLFCSAAAIVPIPHMSAGEFKLEGGFMLLFDGKKLDGWKEFGGKKEALEGKTEAYKGRFKIVDHAIVIDPAVKGDSHIETVKEFAKDVHVKFDFKVGPKCNNDIFLRGSKFDIKLPDGKSKESKSIKEGEWNTMDIIVAGDKIEHKINGETARLAKADAKASTLRIRAEFGAIEIKNIRVKE